MRPCHALAISKHTKVGQDNIFVTARRPIDFARVKGPVATAPLSDLPAGSRQKAKACLRGVRALHRSMHQGTQAAPARREGHAYAYAVSLASDGRRNSPAASVAGAFSRGVA